MQQYVEMSIEEASKLFKGKNGTVLVAVKDLENDDEIVSFIKKTKAECEEVVKNAATITQACDDFMRQLNLYSYRQPDIMNIIPKGKMKTILLQTD